MICKAKTSKKPSLKVTSGEGNNSANSSCLKIRKIEWLMVNQGRETATPKADPQFMLVWIRKGSLMHRNAMSQDEIHEGLYGLAPGYSHKFTPGETTDGYVICFTAESLTDISLADLIFTLNIFSACPVDLLRNCTAETKADVEAILQRLVREMNLYSPDHPELIACYVKILLIYLNTHAKVINQQSGWPRFDTVRRFLALLEINYRSMRQVTCYAAELAISPCYLNLLVKKHTGVAARDLINRRVLLEAKRQARYHSLTMKETAYLLGFEDLSHFSKYFKNLAGMTYSDFRKTI